MKPQKAKLKNYLKEQQLNTPNNSANKHCDSILNFLAILIACFLFVSCSSFGEGMLSGLTIATSGHGTGYGYYNPYYGGHTNSNSSRSSSTQSSSATKANDTSSSDQKSGTYKAKGTYTISSQGRSQTSGQYTGVAGQDFVCEIEFYDDYILVSAVRYDYTKTSNNWKVYEGRGMSFGNMSSYYTYYVDANYNVRQVTTFSSPFGTDWFEHTVVKGEVSIPKYYPNSATTYSGQSQGTTNGSNRSSVTKSSNSSSGNQQCPSLKVNNGKWYCANTGKCGMCWGKGWVNNSLTGKTVDCTLCRRSGKCQYCR